MEHAIDSILEQTKHQNKQEVVEIINSKELSTKGDIRESELRLQKEIEIVRKEIAQSNNKMIIWVFGMMGTFSIFFLGILAKGFHWF